MAADLPLYAYLNQEFLPLKSATLHVSDLAIQRGYGVFDFIKVEGKQPLFLQNYLDRFYSSAGELNLKVPCTKQELKATIFDLVQKNDLGTSGLKMILTGGYSENGFDPVVPNLLIQQQSLTLPGKEMVENGIKVITHEYVRELPEVKTINYTMGIRLQKTVKEKGAADVLYHTNGAVSEFPRCNFFIVKQDGTVATPSQNILRGITRKNVLSLAARKFKAVEEEITLEDVLQAKEAFLTSTTKRVVPIVKVDEAVIGEGKPGEVTLSLLQDLIEFEGSYIRDSNE
ncbi:aminotransferase class IV [Pontibacter locisalis]|uniref:branched-chain-amino-acid transaminase n=1 Tax=Pontibacter locisalis TaxID=1719035 RepID=A0ABW5IQ03_9BACT